MMRLDFNRLYQRLVRRTLRPVPQGVALVAPPPISRLPATHQAAAARLVDHTVCASMQFRRRQIRADSTGSDRLIVEFSQALQKDLVARGIPFFAHTYVRSNEEQERLFRTGVTKARSGQSPHNHGMAVDLVHYGRYWDLTQKEWAVIGLIGKEVARKRNIAITWGGDWKFYDPAHWELSDWKDRVGRS